MNIRISLNHVLANPALWRSLVGILILMISSSFVWMANDHVIAPPVLRILDGRYRVFSGHYFFHFFVL